MSKLSNFKIKWPKSVEKLENGFRQDLPPKWPAGSAPERVQILKMFFRLIAGELLVEYAQ